ncbi:MAG: hypothetical protein L0215_19950 [Gemmataceae bacterium]|nr:hypothetical protein [Gemmataceae bacterium]
MTPSVFENLLRSLLTHQPFTPFRVDLKVGPSFVVDDPEAVAHCNGSAGFISADKEVFFFSYEDVQTIGTLTPGSAS